MRHTIALLVLLLSAPCQAAIYKWVDEKGVTHYTQLPPPGVQAEEIEPLAPAPAGPPPKSEAQGEAAAAQDEPPLPDEVVAVPAEQMAEQCQNARERLEKLLASPRLLYQGEDGEMRRASEEERQRLIDEERRRIELFCE